MSKKCLIRQSAGLGDILLCQKIGYHYQDLGYEIIWPVEPVYSYVKDYLKNFKYILTTDDYEFTDEMITLQLHGSVKKVGGPYILDAKYKISKVDIDDWTDYIHIERNKEKEDKLFYDILGLQDDEEYVLINETFASPPHSQENKIVIKDDHRKQIKMNYIKDITLFDWLKVIENASQIDVVDSCITVLLNLIDLKTEAVTIYSRVNKPSIPSYKQTEHLFNSHGKWNYKQL